MSSRKHDRPNNCYHMVKDKDRYQSDKMVKIDMWIFIANIATVPECLVTT